ncbi:MAG TPA: CapA family protein [Chloroflexi bacterium]|nr:CapA family protein [Chloroflexota bacterium]
MKRPLWPRLIGPGMALVALLACHAAPSAAPSSADLAPVPLPTLLPRTPTSAPATPAATPVPARPVELTVIIVGDVMLGRMVNIGSLEREDFTWPFRGTGEALRAADLTLGNLESPIAEDCPPNEVSTLFCADPRAVEGLAWAGFDGLSLANNHSHDRGDEGFEQTVALLEEAGIAAFYDQTVMVVEIRGVRIGVMGFMDVDRLLDVEAALAATGEMAGQVDVLIGIMHWGYEYVAYHNWRQEVVGRALIDAGMDVVAGAHPHQVQEIEEYNGGVIFYSLGNFVFDQMWSSGTRQGHIARLTFLIQEDGEVGLTYEIIPITIHDFGQPRLEEEAQAQAW